MTEGLAGILQGFVLAKMNPTQSDQAERCILEGIKVLKELQIKPVMYSGYIQLGELYASTGQKDKALETLKKAEAAFQEMGMDYYLHRTQEVLERVAAA